MHKLTFETVATLLSASIRLGRRSRFPTLRGNLTMEHERVAQLVEHRPFKALVLGSSPSPLTTSPSHHHPTTHGNIGAASRR